MATTTPNTAETVEQLACDADDGAARLALTVESIADEVDILAQRPAEFRADVARQRLLLDELRALPR